MRQLGQYPPAHRAIAHLSDPHILAGGALQLGEIDSWGLLDVAMQRLRLVDPPPQAIVFTGDLADKGEPEAYRMLRERVEPVAEEIGAEVIWVMGNHDDRAAYARGLYDAEPGAEGQDAPQDRVHDIDGLRIISLDTSVPGYHHGEISPEQLAWLRDVLATPAPHGTLLAMHHPPIPLPMLRAAELIELHDQASLAAVVEGTDVRGIIAGHLHLSTWSTFAGIPVSVVSSSCSTTDPAPERDKFLSSVDANQSFNMLHVYDDRLVHTHVPLERGPHISSILMETVEPMESLTDAELHEIASSKLSPFNS